MLQVQILVCTTDYGSDPKWFRNLLGKQAPRKGLQDRHLSLPLNCLVLRRDLLAVRLTCLLNKQGLKTLVGSAPTLSASIDYEKVNVNTHCDHCDSLVYSPYYFMSKYTKELLEPIIKECVSVAGVLRKLGKEKLCGGTHTYLSKKIKNLGIDTSHFLGKKANCGSNHKGNKKPWQEILVIRQNDRRENAFRLRRALVESGRKYECEKCERHEWMGKTLILEVDHINRDWLDNRIENIRFLCPNCHSQCLGYNNSKNQTELFATKGSMVSRKASKVNGVNKCKCGKHIHCRSKKCVDCQIKSRIMIEWPDIDKLTLMIKELGFSETGRRLGVSDNAVRKRLKNHSTVGNWKTTLT